MHCQSVVRSMDWKIRRSSMYFYLKFIENGFIDASIGNSATKTEICYCKASHAMRMWNTLFECIFLLSLLLLCSLHLGKYPTFGCLLLLNSFYFHFFFPLMRFAFGLRLAMLASAMLMLDRWCNARLCSIFSHLLNLSGINREEWVTYNRFSI